MMGSVMDVDRPLSQQAIYFGSVKRRESFGPTASWTSHFKYLLNGNSWMSWDNC